MGFLPAGGGLRRILVAAGLVVALALAGRLAAAPASAQEGAEAAVHVANSGANSERLKTVPIGKRARGGQRVVMSLGPAKVQALGSGDQVQGMAELQVSTTCLEPMPKCVGRIYHFTPKIDVRLVLAGGPKATNGGNVVPVSGWRRTRCSQSLPNRNHHCVITIDGARSIPDASKLPCEAGRCHLNMVLSAHHPGAKSGQRLVIGDDQDRGISQNKGQLSVAVYRPANTRAKARTLASRKPRVNRLQVGSRGSSMSGKRRKVVYSLRLNNLRAGERLVVDARMLGKIRHLRYNALVQSQLILSRRPGSVSSAGAPKRIASFGAQAGVLNGFNCTRGRSAHPHPCEVRKNGVVRILRDARARPWKDEGPRIPLYLNLVVGTKAVFGGRHRSSDRMRIKRKGGFVRAQRYGPELGPGADAPPDEDSSGSLPLPQPATQSVVIAGNHFVFPFPQIDEGATLLYANLDAGVRHNVTSREMGPDGRRLFESRSFQGRTADRPVEGTEYLPAGTYGFFCTIHPVTAGNGVLTVREFGNGPVPRPQVGVAIASRKRSDVVRTGRLKVNVRAARPTPARLALVARKGKHKIAERPRVDLDPGQRRIVGMKLTKRGRSLLAKGGRPKVTVVGSVRSGHPSSASRRLR